MKKPIKIAIICLGSLFCLSALLSLFSGIAIEKFVIPQAEELLGVRINIKSASLNLLSGSFTAKGMSVSNPAGFNEPYFITAEKASVKVSIFSLLFGRIVVSRSSLDDFILNIERTEEGDINAAYFANRLNTEETEKQDTQEVTTAPKVPKMRLTRLKADFTLRYVDRAFTTNTIDYSFKTRIAAEDISNYGASDDYGTISLDGHLVSNPEVLSSTISARVATLSDPLHPTFEASGQIKSIHVEEIADLEREIGIHSQEFTIDTPFKSTEGRLRGDLKLTLRDPTPLGSVARKIKNIQLPPVLTVTVPIRGSVEKPRIDWTGAILQSLLDNALENVDAALQKIDLSQEGVEKQIDNLVDSFKGLFRKKKEK